MELVVRAVLHNVALALVMVGWRGTVASASRFGGQKALCTAPHSLDPEWLETDGNRHTRLACSFQTHSYSASRLSSCSCGFALWRQPPSQHLARLIRLAVPCMLCRMRNAEVRGRGEAANWLNPDTRN
jgi:hypothetical protein